MIIREMKSGQYCLCSTPVHTGAFLIGILSVVLEVIAILFEVSSHTEDTPTTQINATEFADNQVKVFEYASYYSDKIIVGSGLLRHVFYYVLHVIGFISAILLIYGNRKSIPKLYIPYLAVGAAEIVVAIVELVMFIVAIIGIKAGGYADIPSDPAELRSVIVFFLIAIIIIELVVIGISLYFLWVVWRGKLYLEDYQNNPYNNDAFTVSYTNQGADTNGTTTPQPNVPATYRI